eukprot:CAMPEP_0170495388 /NCGR_PEP_ID=MMETSP0208-20121228/15497_1 /TAXON_ID=197538 /ORGANISM="Strombidium inclinatum, Strain S3" /LENGTH=44 /DNA_ID= /DNA_START= /DNA_END= /DNA_ORIENTATION=
MPQMQQLQQQVPMNHWDVNAAPKMMMKKMAKKSMPSIGGMFKNV